MRPGTMPTPAGPMLYEHAVRDIVATVIDWLNDENLEMEGDKFWKVVKVLYEGTVGEGEAANPEGVVNLKAYRDLVTMAARGARR